ncbi:MAG TPA: LOG family protein [Terriglobia bacterium]|nr:LOG family protein [Terriglobia bacterium]
MKTVTIFGSSLPPEHTSAYHEAVALGRALAQQGLAVCNGGYGGLMEASARGACDAGGHTIGITCCLWSRKANPWIKEEVHTASFPERIMTLIARGDAYLVLPGGTGTLAELALAWELMNKSVLAATVGGRKPLLLLGSYWQPVIECLDQEPKLASPTPDRHLAAMELITVVPDAAAAAQVLAGRLRE